MNTQDFRVVVEPDEDRWSAYCPVLLSQGAATWGYTRDEALKHVQEVVQMVVEALAEEGTPIPTEPASDVMASHELLITVTI